MAPRSRLHSGLHPRLLPTALLASLCWHRPCITAYLLVHTGTGFVIPLVLVVVHTGTESLI